MTTISPHRYNIGARALHWIIAVMLAAELTIGLFHEALEDVVRLIPVHKALGLTILVLSITRLTWRLCWKRPSLPLGMPRLEAVAAHGVHMAFYVLLIAMPLSGWHFSSAGKYPLSWFGLFEIPKLPVTRNGLVYAISRTGHKWLGWLFLALILLHVAAALRHHFILRDGLLRRMF